jgi:hypothetical protein
VSSSESSEKKPMGDTPQPEPEPPKPPEPPEPPEPPPSGDIEGAPPLMGDPHAPPPAQPMRPPVSTPPPPPLPPIGGPTAPPKPPPTPTYPFPASDPSTKDAMYNTVYNRMGGNNNLLGWLAVLLGIIGSGCCCCWSLDGTPFVGGIPAIILGFLHLQRIKQQRASMAWLGWTGIVLGVIAVLGALCSFTTNWNDHLHDQLVNSY